MRGGRVLLSAATATLFAAMTSSPAVAAPATPTSAAADAPFDAMEALVGTWRPAERPESPLRIRFSLTAGGSVLVEEWLRGDRPHSLTLYHRDGDRFIATHYCPQGNQPRLALTPGRPSGELRFAFRDATDLDLASESYLVALSFDLSDRDAPVRRETYRHAGNDESSELKLARVP